jgi:hypothetical protein
MRVKPEDHAFGRVGARSMRSVIDGEAIVMTATSAPSAPNEKQSVAARPQHQQHPGHADGDRNPLRRERLARRASAPRCADTSSGAHMKIEYVVASDDSRTASTKL